MVIAVDRDGGGDGVSLRRLDGLKDPSFRSTRDLEFLFGPASGWKRGWRASCFPGFCFAERNHALSVPPEFAISR